MVHPLLALALSVLTVSAVPFKQEQAASDPTGPWRAVLQSPGGELPFGLEFSGSGWELTAHIVNGEERIAIPRVEREARTLVFEIDHYASRIVADLAADGGTMRGIWTKRSSGGSTSSLPFHAEAGRAPRFPSQGTPLGPTADIGGRWSVRFASDDELSVGIFQARADGTTLGTFLTTTGDYRYLAGRMEGNRLRLSCFDGAHAFLFDARLTSANSLEGDFWSRNSWHDTWTAQRDEDAQLPDPWSRTGMPGDPALALHVYPLAVPALGKRSGELVSLAAPEFIGKVLVLEVFGSWCPNCHDLARTLGELRARFDEDDVTFVGLAFELTGNFDTDRVQVERYVARHGLTMPVLLCGSADKAKAAEAVPGLTRVESFPTTIFVGRDGRVRKVHSGFTGPGTGAAYETLVHDFEETIAALVAEPTTVDTGTVEALKRGPWRDTTEESFTEFTVRGDADGSYVADAIFSFFAPPAEGPLHIGSWLLAGQTLHQWQQASDESPEPNRARVPRTTWHFDPAAGVFLDPADFGHRLIPGARPIIPVVGTTGPDKLEDIRARLADKNPVWRREAVFALARLVVEARKPNPFADEGEEPPPVPEFDPTALIADADPWVRCTAAWAAGVCQVEGARDALVLALDHGHAALRREAARALGKLVGGEAARKRLEALHGDIDPSVREAAREALAAFEE